MRTSASLAVQHDSAFSPFPAADFLRGLAWAKASGFDAVELILCDPRQIDPGALAEQLDNHGLSASTISTGQAVGLEGLSMTSPDRQVRKATRRRLFDHVDFSARIGRPNVTIGLLRGRGGSAPASAEYALLKDELLEVAAYAGASGVVVNLEPINRYECTLLNTSESVFELIMEIGNPVSVGILYDTFHSNIEDADMTVTLDRIGPKISHVHLADSNRRLPGEGHIDFRSILGRLALADYDGYLSLEVLNGPSANHVLEFAGVRMAELQS